MSKAKLHRRTPNFEPTYSKYLGVPNIVPESVFPELIQRDKSLCSNCWTDRYSYEAEDFYGGSENGWMRYELRRPIPGRNYPDVVPEQRHDGSPRCCTHCGFESGRDRPLSLEAACEYAHNLHLALKRRNIPHDRQTLLQEIRRRKRQPENQSHAEQDIYGAAVAEAVRVGRR